MENSRAIAAKVNNEFSFSAEQLAAADITPAGEGIYHILLDGRAYIAEVEAVHFHQKNVQVKINGASYRINLADRYDQMVDRLGLGVVHVSAARDIKAPMPGLVIEVLVQAGDQVQKDTPLLILEAMKMENVIKAPGEGVVKSVTITKGIAVEKNALLIAME